MFCWIQIFFESKISVIKHSLSHIHRDYFFAKYFKVAGSGYYDLHPGLRNTLFVQISGCCLLARSGSHPFQPEPTAVSSPNWPVALADIATQIVRKWPKFYPSARPPVSEQVCGSKTKTIKRTFFPNKATTESCLSADKFSIRKAWGNVGKAFTFGVAFLLSATAAGNANTDEGQTLGLGGDSPPMCAITSAPAGGQAANMSLQQSDLTQGRVVIDQLIDPSSARLQPASIQLTFDVTCNGPHRVKIRSVNGVLELETPLTTLTPSFVTQVNYNAALTWNNESISMVAEGNEATAQSTSLAGSAARGIVELEIQIDASLNDMTKPLVKGKYSDTLKILLSPQF